MDIELIKSPSSSVIEMVKSRSSPNIKDSDFMNGIGAIGLVQGKVLRMLVAADIAEKHANVKVVEVRGLCPQHFTLIAVLGDISSVSEALENVAARFDKSWNVK